MLRMSYLEENHEIYIDVATLQREDVVSSVYMITTHWVLVLKWDKGKKAKINRKM